jgi:hypothetical protein
MQVLHNMKDYVSVTTRNRLHLSGAEISVYSENHLKYLNTFVGKMQSFFLLKQGGNVKVNLPLCTLYWHVGMEDFYF